MEGDRAHLLRSPIKEQNMQQQFIVSSEAVEAEARADAMQDLQVNLHSTRCALSLHVSIPSCNA